MRLKSSLIVLGLTCSALVWGQEATDYDASVSLGFVNTSGNTETATFNTEFLVVYRVDNWTHNGKFQALGASEDSVTSAERYFMEDKSDFALDENQYVYARADYTDDRFSGFDYQAAGSGGFGRYFTKTDELSLQGFAGAGYRQNSITNAGSEGEAILTLGQDLAWQISNNAALTQSFISDVGNDLTISRFEVGLESNIIDRVATRIAFQARNTSKVPVGNKKTDTLTSVALVYTF